MIYIKKLVIILAILAIILFFVSEVHASTNAICDEGEHIGNPHCIEIVPTDVQPTPTDEVPTPTSCIVWEGEFPIPCPTGTPIATVTPTEQPSGGSQGGDNRSDNLGCGSHDCSVHVVVPLQAPATGRAM